MKITRDTNGDGIGFKPVPSEQGVDVYVAVKTWDKHRGATTLQCAYTLKEAKKLRKRLDQAITEAEDE